ncbi:MAG TPA: nucleoside deaminase, partial [Candidatus Desulfofervidus auxilii]|nr:nucleoside deaminase [Candidatus Desulfofervidus auxilii]
MERDEYFMRLAIREALKAEAENEVPVGAVLVKGEEILAMAHNQVIQKADPTAHAEILVLREAALKLKNYRLLDTELYVTIEPCMMCGGAIIQAR